MSLQLSGDSGVTYTDGSNQPYASSPYGIKNRLINGNFSIWQRGTSFTTTSGTWTYTADRFAVYCGGANATWSQNTSVPTGFQYSLKMQRTASQTYTNWLYATQVIESSNCIDLAGQTVTFSFWAKAGANFSATNNLVNVQLITGTGTDQGVSSLGGGTWTGQTNAVNTTQAITTTWTKYTFTATLGASVTEVAIQLSFTPTGTAGADDSLYICGTQLEIGSTATPFERRMYGQELLLCQRYYEKSYNINAAPATAQNEGQRVSAGNTGTTTTGEITVSCEFNTRKRAAPTMVTYDAVGNSGKCTRTNIGVANYDNSAIDVVLISETNAYVYSNTGSAACFIRYHFTANAEL